MPMQFGKYHVDNCDAFNEPIMLSNRGRRYCTGGAVRNASTWLRCIWKPEPDRERLPAIEHATAPHDIDMAELVAVELHVAFGPAGGLQRGINLLRIGTLKRVANAVADLGDDELLVERVVVLDARVRDELRLTRRNPHGL